MESLYLPVTPGDTFITKTSPVLEHVFFFIAWARARRCTSCQETFDSVEIPRPIIPPRLFGGARDIGKIKVLQLGLGTPPIDGLRGMPIEAQAVLARKGAPEGTFGPSQQPCLIVNSSLCVKTENNLLSIFEIMNTGKVLLVKQFFSLGP